MNDMNNYSEYAPAPRIEKVELKKRVAYLFSIPHFKEILNSLSSIAIIANSERQILFASNDFLSLIENTNNADVFGIRPGEVLQCINKDKNVNGCGTSSYCRQCGFVNTILESQKLQQKVSNDARITIKKNGHNESLDLRVTVSPLPIYDDVFYIITILDITDDKRRKLLERMFFHDILNTAGGFNNLMEYVYKESVSDADNEFFKMASMASKSIYDQIISYRQLSMAEKGDLIVNNSSFNTMPLIESIVELFNANSKHKYEVIIENESVDVLINSDKTLVERIVTNMIKNAIEAPSDVKPALVFIKCTHFQNSVRISVKNNFVMPDDIKHQIFQRSFSTKSDGRGVGTYSMKLLGERYLGGQVDFVSNITDGTMFFIDLPLNK